MLKPINEPLKMHLQYFAEPEPEPNPEPQPEPTEKVELTPDELQKKIESESDRKLAKALEKKQQEWEEKQQEAIQKALEEKERLAKLSEKEREQELLSEERKKLEQDKAEYNRRVLRADAVDDLQEKGLPSNFADFLLGEDAEGTLENINNFKTAFDEAVNATVKEKLRQDTPPAGTGAFRSGKAPSVEDLAKESRLIK